LSDSKGSDIMNNDQFKGTVRNLGGQVEDEFGKLVGDPEVRSEGIVDQVTGTAQSVYGDAKELATSAYRQASPIVREGAERAIDVTRENTVLAVLAAGAVGYALSWAVHGGKAQVKHD
jgi:uncharacterized protein YjbJ (UPF0337 family)